MNLQTTWFISWVFITKNLDQKCKKLFCIVVQTQRIFNIKQKFGKILFSQYKLLWKLNKNFS